MMKTFQKMYYQAKGRYRRALFRYARPELALALRHLEQRVERGNFSSPFPTRNLVVAQRLPDSPALVLAPHPDDEAIGPGGTLALMLDAGAAVTVLYLTDGRGPGEGDLNLAETRRREAEALGAAFPLRQIFWEVPDNHLTNSPETVQALVDVLREIQPASIFLPSFFDHQYDHFAANLVLADALERYSGDATIYGYEVWDNLPFPNYLVDLSAGFERKAEMLQHYRVPNQVTDFIRFCRHRSALHYLLYVNSVRREPEGCAEAFYRLDPESFRDYFAAYRGALHESGSQLLTRAASPGRGP